MPHVEGIQKSARTRGANENSKCLYWGEEVGLLTRIQPSIEVLQYYRVLIVKEDVTGLELGIEVLGAFLQKVLVNIEALALERSKKTK